MNAWSSGKLLGTLLLCAVPAAVSAVEWIGKNVGQLESMYEGQDCVYFTLQGVPEADPIKPGDPWFAISRRQLGSRDAFTMLLAAKVGGHAVSVRTRAALTCGYATVTTVWMP